MTIVEMRVHMDCPGCESKIKKALRKLDGVDNVDVDMGMQKVTVTGYADQEKVLKTVRKTGRLAELWPFPYNPEYHDFNYAYYSHYYRNPATNFSVNPENYFASEATVFTKHDKYSFSSYNYEVHGYNGHDHGYYHKPPLSTVIDDRTRDMFSDENAHGCSIM
ncbi:heavy metal-associated isoprenylated plant protein 29-like [Coffea arabica]|uniref:Heavy metal-associated isoprenylated plant protein 29-like n=1 Tax=Coffea arabica TaxID=13443 RepID=A0A6P6W2V2_COFAR|nr:heavy metal-associated isoprenylated plant protein 29-like [Coffea arabica]